jgi:predicted transposase/invertase (TIGR01784 family)
MDVCRISKLTAMEKKKYRESILEYEDVREVVEYAKELAAKEAYETGVAKGKEVGIAEGIAEGIKQTAKNFLKMGIPVADVVKATGLSEEQLLAL